MMMIAAIAYFAGAAIGLQLNIRMVIAATMLTLLGCLASALIGWTGPVETIFGAFTTIAALQTGYVTVVLLNAFGMVGAREMLSPVRFSSPSASDSPSRR